MDNIENARRGAHDNRQLFEVFSQMISDRTNGGDLIRLKVIWAPGDRRPRILAEFLPAVPEKKAGWVEFTEFLPEVPGRINPVSRAWQGFHTWRDALLHMQEGIAVRLEGMVRRAGRRVMVIEERGQ